MVRVLLNVFPVLIARVFLPILFVFLRWLVSNLLISTRIFFFQSLPLLVLDFLPPQRLLILLPQLHGAHHLLLHQQIEVIITFQSTAQVVLGVLDSLQALPAFGENVLNVVTPLIDFILLDLAEVAGRLDAPHVVLVDVFV